MSSSRNPGRIRPISFTPGFVKHPAGSVLCKMGNTHVLCNVAFEPGVPRFLKDSGKGWLTAEYAMLPQATHTRSQRESVKGKIGGRTAEISRLVGRALRAMVDLEQLGENTLTIDCDVLQADGGTRTAAINGASMALMVAMERLMKQKKLAKNPVIEPACAISVGIIEGKAWVDLSYELDSNADIDLNVVGLYGGGLVEVQGTSEKRAVSHKEFQKLLTLATDGLQQVAKAEQAFLKKQKIKIPGLAAKDG